jgi:methylphosphotriester-DNA--protein-cysteine methyltransferase
MKSDAGPIHGCRSTRIYCLPTCRYDRRVLAKNRMVFASIEEARGAGYRPCKVCRPDSNVRPSDPQLEVSEAQQA